jgi:O-antigen/teichoic acid export membrane protein
LLLYFKFGVTGYLVSTVASYVVPSVYYCFVIKIHKAFGAFDKKLLREMLVYSIPLIPNSILWWAMTGANKYILVYAVGQAANGIFVVAQKLPSVVNIISTVFMQSWQISAVDEAESQNKSQFYSDIFNTLAMVMLLATSFLTAIVKPLYSVWLAPEYYEAWKYTTILMLANVFSCFSTFVGVNYIAMKKTKGNLKTALVGGVVSIVLGLVFIPLFGVYAAAVSTMVSFLATWLYRLLDTRKFIEIRADYLKIMVVMCVIVVQTVLLFINDSVGIQIAFVCLACVLYFKELKSILYTAFNIIKSKKGNI